jgi:hypothetical protein
MVICSVMALPDQDPARLREWMVQEDWQVLLEASTGRNRSWLALLHLGSCAWSDR